jgi:L-asparaginase
MQLLFIQTGGTIDKDYPKTIKGYGFEITEPAVKRILERIKIDYNFEIITFIKKDSQDITNNDRLKLTQLCEKTQYDKIIITHGTDTIIETAKQLSVIKNKKIILTGAFTPEKFKDSDADFNVGCAIGAIEYVPLGVYVAMNGKVFKHNEVKRNLKTGQFVRKK